MQIFNVYYEQLGIPNCVGRFSWNKYICRYNYSEIIMEWLLLTRWTCSQAISDSDLLSQGDIKMGTVLNKEILYCKLSAWVSWLAHWKCSSIIKSYFILIYYASTKYMKLYEINCGHTSLTGVWSNWVKKKKIWQYFLLFDTVSKLIYPSQDILASIETAVALQLA